MAMKGVRKIMGRVLIQLILLMEPWCASTRNICTVNVMSPAECRLTAKEELHVPHDHVDEFCSGPCLEETNLVLDCIDGIMDHFTFFNKATTQDVRDTILAGCGHGDKRGFFDVGEHVEADEGRGIIGSKATMTVLSGILISIIGQIVLLL
ncbi:hypothetical protein SOVF_126710 isoform A [Spinacia oleracea]|nr:hypothetical protein SOVF_126710 isoform A [Spinacia oleracea]